MLRAEGTNMTWAATLGDWTAVLGAVGSGMDWTVTTAMDWAVGTAMDWAVCTTMNWAAVLGNWATVVRNWTTIMGEWTAIMGEWTAIVRNWTAVMSNWTAVLSNWTAVVSTWTWMERSRVANAVVRLDSAMVLVGKSTTTDEVDAVSLIKGAFFLNGRESATIELRTTLTINALVHSTRRVQPNADNIVQGTLELRTISIGHDKRGWGLYLAMIVRLWEHHFRSNLFDRNSIDGSIEQLGTEWSPLSLDARVSESLNQALLSLDGCIADLGNLVSVVHVPTHIGKHVVEGQDILRGGKVDESIANVALVVEVNTQVEEVVLSGAALIQHALELERLQLVRNIAQHHSGADVQTMDDSFRNYHVVVVVMVLFGMAALSHELFALTRTQRAVSGISMLSDHAGSLDSISQRTRMRMENALHHRQ
jgi:hypothetical protein